MIKPFPLARSPGPMVLGTQLLSFQNHAFRKRDAQRRITLRECWIRPLVIAAAGSFGALLVFCHIN